MVEVYHPLAALQGVVQAAGEKRLRTMGRKHLLYMAGGAVAVFGVLVISGVPASTALVWGLLLACPLMMIGMMFSMNHGDMRPPPNDHSDQDVRSDSTHDTKGQHRLHS
jgi:hypothetical protein